MEIVVFHTWSKTSQISENPDENFINALEYNSIKGINFGRRDVKIVTEI